MHQCQNRPGFFRPSPSCSSLPPQSEDIPMLAAISEVQVELHRADKRIWHATGGGKTGLNNQKRRPVFS
jgi:hypothetical protein